MRWLRLSSPAAAGATMKGNPQEVHVWEGGHHLVQDLRPGREADKAACRCRVVKDQEVTIPDLVRGDVTFNTNTLGDFVILRSNGLPVYVSPSHAPAPHSTHPHRGLLSDWL